MDQSLQDQKARQEQYQREMKPMIENVRIIDEKVKNLIDYSQGLDKRLQAEADERKKMGVTFFRIFQSDTLIQCF